MDITGEFWSRFDTWAGPPFGVFLLLIGVFLMIEVLKESDLSFLTVRIRSAFQCISLR